MVQPAGAREVLIRELFGGDSVPRRLDGRLLRTREVAVLFQVSERAVTDWASKGRIPSVRTPGGHRRYPADLIRQLLSDTIHPVERALLTSGSGSTWTGVTRDAILSRSHVRSKANAAILPARRCDRARLDPNL